uniref:Uncharacterized protein n=1 Tax=Meloidogyne enterolobii TaxID=390850 RepID=A0A6V7ULZ5_MELEN|nr:unnamed protein product [Meloidogyne enterolobii]
MILIFIFTQIIFASCSVFPISEELTPSQTESEFLFDYIIFISGLNLCLKGEEVIGNNDIECYFCTEDWIKFKKLEIDDGMNNYSILFRSIGGIAADRLKIEGCLKKKDADLFVREATIFSRCQRDECLNSQRKKVLENVAKLVKEMKDIFQKKLKLDDEINGERISQDFDSHQRSNIVSIRKYSRKLLFIVWMFTNLLQILNNGKIPGTFIWVQLGKREEEVKIIEWLQSHLKVLLINWFIEKEPKQNLNDFDEIIESERIGVLNDYLNIYKNFFTEEVFNKIINDNVKNNKNNDEFKKKNYLKKGYKIANKLAKMLRSVTNR